MLSVLPHNNFFITPVRPDVLREIENRGKKNGTIGLNVGLGPTSNTLVFQKDILKKMIDPAHYTMLMNQIVPVSKRKESSHPATNELEKRPLELEEEEEEDELIIVPKPVAKKAKTIRQGQQPCPELLSTYISKCNTHYANEEFDRIPSVFAMNPPETHSDFLNTPTGECLVHFCEYIKNKL
jgi:hypothetical protein